MPNCRDELLAFLEEFLELDPYDIGPDYTLCGYCYALKKKTPTHTDDCLWKRAKKLIEEIENANLV